MFFLSSPGLWFTNLVCNSTLDIPGCYFPHLPNFRRLNPRKTRQTPVTARGGSPVLLPIQSPSNPTHGNAPNYRQRYSEGNLYMIKMIQQVGGRKIKDANLLCTFMHEFSFLKWLDPKCPLWMLSTWTFQSSHHSSSGLSGLPTSLRRPCLAINFAAMPKSRARRAAWFNPQGFKGVFKLNPLLSQMDM